MKQFLWKCLGFASLGLAYVGLITPGLPYSPFIVFAAYCFSKGSPRMHAWIYNHKVFGPFLTNWTEKRVFPLRMKYFMLAMMSLSLYLTSLKFPADRLLQILIVPSNESTVFEFSTMLPSNAVMYTAIFMALVAIWAWRFPSSVEEHDRRTAQGKKIGWLK